MKDEKGRIEVRSQETEGAGRVVDLAGRRISSFWGRPSLFGGAGRPDDENRIPGKITLRRE